MHRAHIMARTLVQRTNHTIPADERTIGLKTGDGGCTADEFLTGDSDLPVCVEMDDDNWDTTFLEELGNDQNCEEVASWQRQ